MSYYLVSVAFEQVYEVLVSAEDKEKAEDYARKYWGENEPLDTNIDVFDIQELQIKKGKIK
jgi:hypothetical protein